MKILDREIATGLKPYIVAEAGANHAGSLQNALKLVNLAKWAGADAVKFQAYTADTITIDHKGADFLIKDGPWKDKWLYDLYKSAETPFAWYEMLMNEGKKLGTPVFFSVFDETAVDLLEKLDCPAYKIASAEITDLNLISYAAKTGKPMIISTGMADTFEVQSAIDTVMGYQETYPVVLHCVSGYPTNVRDANLMRMNGFYPFPAGVSDHSKSHIVPIAATAMGACLIEKHLMIENGPETEDSEFSLTPVDFYRMVMDVSFTWQSLQPSVSLDEEATRQMRRSLYVVKDIANGERFTKDNVRSIRPAYGLPPLHLGLVLACRANRALSRGTALKEEYLG